MADTTISSLPLGTPSGNSVIPFSQGGNTFITSVQGLTSAGSFLPVYSNLTKPAIASVGQIIYNTDEGIVQVWVGNGWQNVNVRAGIYPTIEAAQADGVIMYWPMVNTAQTTSVIGGSNITIQTTSNNIQNATGIAGGAILRGENYVTDFIRFNSVPVNSISNNIWSVSMWFYKTSNSIYAASDGVGVIWPYYGTDTTNSGGFSTVAGLNPMWGYAGSNAEALYGYNWPNSTNSANIVTYGFLINSWYHLVVTHTNNSLKHYVNGNLLLTLTNNPTINSNWSLGNYYYVQNGNSNNHYGKGRYDEIVLFNKELTSTEVSNLYNKQLTGRALVTGITY